MGGNEWANSSHAATELHSLSFISMWHPPWSFLLICFFLFPGLMALPEESYHVRLWLHCLVFASRHSTSEMGDDGSLCDTAPKSLLLSPFHCACIHTEECGGAQSRASWITRSSARTLPPSHTQTRSSTISSQRDCTHWNKQRRQLLSERNYLVLSISSTAEGQRALCWWG